MNQEKQIKLESAGYSVGNADDFLRIPLESSFERWGSHWTILERTSDWALVKQDSGGRPNYNVCKIKKTNEAPLPNGKTIPAQEALPSAEEYGRLAWCFCELENAEKKYDEMAFGK